MSNFKIMSSRRSVLKGMAGGAAALAIGGLAAPALGQSRQLNIINNDATQPAQEALKKIADAFGAETGTNVTLNFMDHEGHKTAIRNYLVVSAPDICFWFSGNRMKAFVNRGLLEDISDLVTAENYAAVLGGTLGATTVGGKQYGLPLGGRLWGNYYLKSVFDEHGLTAPTNWDELLAFGDSAKAAKLIPFTIGTKEIWPTGGFFDILNLRINGRDAHLALMDGEISYLDPMLTPVFDHWEELIKKDFFLPNHTSYTWNEASALLGQRQAAMIHGGSHVSRQLPEADIPSLTYAAFPKIADMPRFEEFSVDSIHVPANAKNKDIAKEFLAYFYRPENLGAYLGSKNAVPPRNDIPSTGDRLVDLQVEQLQQVAATTQYYDRDTDPDMAQQGINGFQEFMVYPDRRQAILTRLEETRKRIFG
jgi:multiple sugar transport system substrate-binding protein